MSRGILPAAKLWWIFEKSPQKSASSLFSELLKNPTEFHLCEAKFCPRQVVKAFNLKAKFIDRANIFKVALAYRSDAPLNRCSPKDEDLTLNDAFLRALPRVRSSPAAFIKFRSSLFKSLRGSSAPRLSSPPAEVEILLNGIFFLLSFFFCACYRQKKKRQCLCADNRPIKRSNLFSNP